MICGSPIAAAPICAYGFQWDATITPVVGLPILHRPSVISRTLEQGVVELTAMQGVVSRTPKYQVVSEIIA